MTGQVVKSRLFNSCLAGQSLLISQPENELPRRKQRGIVGDSPLGVPRVAEGGDPYKSRLRPKELGI